MKKILFLVMMCVITLNAMGQATSLVVDNQTPGWLSSKINYSDQQTLVNLKVTGYINNTDLAFIGNLMAYYSLKGTLDLGEVQIIGSEPSANNLLDNSKEILKGKLRKYILPVSLDSAYSVCTGIDIDTLVVGGSSLPVIYPTTFDKYSSYVPEHIKNLILREGVTKIEDKAFQGRIRAHTALKSIRMPSSLRVIGNNAFENCHKLENVVLPDSITSIGCYAFVNDSVAFKDTLKLPSNLKKVDLLSFSYGENIYVQNLYEWRAEFYIEKNMNIIFPKDISEIKMCGVKGDAQIIWHVKNPIPPSLSISSIYTVWSDQAKQSIIAYVPKASLSRYKNAWKDITIFAESIPATGISISIDTLKLQKNHTFYLSADVLPTDADSKEIIWKSGNISIVSIDKYGSVRALSSGKTYIYASLAANPQIKDSCFVQVYQPVTDIELNYNEKNIKVGESFDLKATVFPSDADNKNVIWESSNETIANVAEGKVQGQKAGTAIISAISKSDSTIKSQCTVTVLQPVEGISLDKSTVDLNAIGETMQLTATVIPDDASDKTVNWRSSDEKVCLVANGKVLAVGYGTAVIIATTDDGGYMASCTVNVNNTTGVNGLTIDKDSSYKIYTVDGKQISRLQKGVNIIRFNNGISKLIIKND